MYLLINLYTLTVCRVFLFYRGWSTLRRRRRHKRWRWRWSSSFPSLIVIFKTVIMIAASLFRFPIIPISTIVVVRRFLISISAFASPLDGILYTVITSAVVASGEIFCITTVGSQVAAETSITLYVCPPVPPISVTIIAVLSPWT